MLLTKASVHHTWHFLPPWSNYHGLINIIHQLNILWNVQVIQASLSYIMVESGIANIALGHQCKCILLFISWENRVLLILPLDRNGKGGFGKIKAIYSVAGLCWSDEAERPYLRLPLSEFALVYCHLLASKDITLSQATPFGTGKCQKRASAGSHPQPIPQAAGRRSAPFQRWDLGCTSQCTLQTGSSNDSYSQLSLCTLFREGTLYFSAVHLKSASLGSLESVQFGFIFAFQLIMSISLCFCVFRMVSRYHFRTIIFLSNFSHSFIH